LKGVNAFDALQCLAGKPVLLISFIPWEDTIIMEKTSVTLQDIREAAERIRPYIRHTPLLRENKMDRVLGCQAYLKPEMLQITGAFKLRGALSKILSLTPEELKKGIITSSSGNHAQACAYAGQMLGIHTTVVIPEDAPTIKIENAKAMGAEVIVWNRKYAERWKKVLEEVDEHGYIISRAPLPWKLWKICPM
jgi:threonine dehydratase